MEIELRLNLHALLPYIGVIVLTGNQQQVWVLMLMTINNEEILAQISVQFCLLGVK